MRLPEEEYMEALVQAVEAGGAGAVRVEGVENVRRLRKQTKLPIIGFVMGAYKDGSELITPTHDDARKLADAGADIVAVDGTNRVRPGGEEGFTFVDNLRSSMAVPLWCDICSFQEGIRCAELGADLVATTLAGFTPATTASGTYGPDYGLIGELSSSLVIPVVAEGRILTPEDAIAALEAGAWAVVAGKVITMPSILTKMFVSSMNQRNWGNF